MSIVATHVDKVIGRPPTRVLTDVTLAIDDGEFIALTGRSGSGKSTLLYLLSSLDTAYDGRIELGGRSVNQMDEAELGVFRNREMGFVFQFHYLLAELTALENVLMPARKARQEAEKTTAGVALLEQVGLADKRDRLPRELSGGEQQRVALARALIMQPRYLFADEPTGNLDSANGAMVMRIIRDANEKLGTTVILVTHDAGFAHMAKRQVQLVDGKIVNTATAS